MAETTTNKYDVFLSYHSSDRPKVEELAKRLVDEAGFLLFYDMWNLIPGAPWQEGLESALDQSNACAVFFGSSGVGPWQNKEVRSALSRRVSENDFRVIPVLLPGTDRHDLPAFLGQMTWVDFNAGLDDEEAFARLMAGVRGEQPGRNQTLQALGGSALFSKKHTTSSPTSKNSRSSKTQIKSSTAISKPSTNTLLPNDDLHSPSHHLKEFLFGIMIKKSHEIAETFVEIAKALRASRENSLYRSTRTSFLIIFLLAIFIIGVPVILWFTGLI